MTSPCFTAGQGEDAAIQLERDFIDIVREEIGMHEAIASVFANALVRGLRRRLGGQEVYIPATDTHARDERIRREFTGPASLMQIQRWSGLSRTSIYRIAGRRPPPVGEQGAPKNPILPVETGRTYP